MRSLNVLHITSTFFFSAVTLSSCGDSPAFSVRSSTSTGSADAAAQYADDCFEVPGVNDSRFRLRTFSLTSELESRLVYDPGRVVKVIEGKDGHLTLNIPTQAQTPAERKILPDKPSHSLAFAPSTPEALAPAPKSDVSVTLQWPSPIEQPSGNEANPTALLLHDKANAAPKEHSEKTKKHTEKQKTKVKKNADAKHSRSNPTSDAVTQEPASTAGSRSGYDAGSSQCSPQSADSSGGSDVALPERAPKGNDDHVQFLAVSLRASISDTNTEPSATLSGLLFLGDKIGRRHYGHLKSGGAERHGKSVPQGKGHDKHHDTLALASFEIGFDRCEPLSSPPGSLDEPQQQPLRFSEVKQCHDEVFTAIVQGQLDFNGAEEPFERCLSSAGVICRQEGQKVFRPLSQCIARAGAEADASAPENLGQSSTDATDGRLYSLNQCLSDAGIPPCARVPPQQEP